MKTLNSNQIINYVEGWNAWTQKILQWGFKGNNMMMYQQDDMDICKDIEIPILIDNRFLIFKYSLYISDSHA